MRRGLRALLLLGCVIALLASGGCRRNDRDLIADNELLFREAQEAIAKRKFLEAIRVLGDIGLINPVSDSLDPLVKLALAEAYFYQSGGISIVEAQSRYEQFLSFYPTHPRADEARYMIGLCLFRQAESPENDQEYSFLALNHYAAMVRDLDAGDRWHLPAKQMLVRVQDRLAEHEWQVANFYLERGHYLGAIGRYQTLVDNYPLSSRRPEAFLRMARAYREVDDRASARLAVDRLIEEYQKGEVVEQARALLVELEGGA